MKRLLLVGLLALCPQAAEAQRWTTGFTKARYVVAGRSISMMGRDELAAALSRCDSTVWRAVIDAIEDQGTEFPDTVYFRIAMVLDSTFYAKADTTVVPWATQLYQRVYQARHPPTLRRALPRP